MNIKEEKTYCTKCEKETASVRVERCHYVCKECNHDKSLSDFYLWELQNSRLERRELSKNERFIKTKI